MLKQIKAVLWGGGPLTNLFRSAVVLVTLLLAAIYCSTASFAKDPWWFKSDFADRPNRVVVYHDGQRTELQSGDAGFNELADAVTASLAGGVLRQSDTGLSDVSRQEAYARYVTVEAFFAQPVTLHAGFYTGHPTQMLFPITGRHSDFSIVFLGSDGEYWVNAPALKTTEPLRQAVKELGYVK